MFKEELLGILTAKITENQKQIEQIGENIHQNLKKKADNMGNN